jgi:predicted RNA binding protein YcfA (HicA-like mRNA interferase family)
MTAREVEAILRRAGFEVIRIGSHRIWGKESRIVPVPMHAGDIPKGTLHNIIKQSGMTVDEFLSLR